MLNKIYISSLLNTTKARSMFWVLVLLSLIGLTMASVTPLHAAEEDIKAPLADVIAELKIIEGDLKKRRLNASALVKVNKTLITMKGKAGECVVSYEKIVEEKKKSLEGLGEKKRGEPAEVLKQRQQLQVDLARDESILGTCKAIGLRLDTAIALTEKQHQQRLEEKLLSRGPDIFKIIDRNLKEPVEWFTDPWNYSKKYGWLRQAPKNDLLILLAVIISSIGIGIIIRLHLIKWVKRQYWSNEIGGRFTESVLASFCHDAPYLLSSVFTGICLHYLTLGLDPQPIITTLAYALVFLFVVRFIIRFTLAPATPGRLFLEIKSDTAKALANRFNVLTLILFFSYLLVDNLISSSLSDYAIRLANSVIYILFAVNLIWALWLFRDLRGMIRQTWFRYSLSLVSVIAVIADLTGYFNLAGWLFRSIFGTLLAFAVILLGGRLIIDVLEGLEYGKTPWQRGLRRLFGLTTEGHITGFFWIRLLVMLGLWGLLILLLIFIWDVSASVVAELQLMFTNGFTIGSLKVVPARIMLALINLGVLVTLSAWIQGQFKRRWLKSMPVERGAREALITMVGYIGVSMAILISLGVAGIDFANLAIIAGALSVGIGFGLQNIVNNFVSGLILLFERPIKTGDWVVVGNTEGYVKRIRIRATQIQTFDRADVIVPNSEFISAQVTNWMLEDPRGRARIPVGVAYGSDTAKVRDILLKVALEHPEIITDGSSPEPVVLFLQFGDSSLDFELRVHIRNVDNRLRVKSDINFAIDQAFRENGVEIPFPQRDVHVRDMPKPKG